MRSPLLGEFPLLLRVSVRSQLQLRRQILQRRGPYTALLQVAAKQCEVREVDETELSLFDAALLGLQVRLYHHMSSNNETSFVHYPSPAGVSPADARHPENS